MKPLRSLGYLDHIRQEKCTVNLRVCPEATQAAHGPVNGMASKGPDNEAIPLCWIHHREQHRMGWPAFETRYGFSRAETAAKHWNRYVELNGDKL